MMNTDADDLLPEQRGPAEWFLAIHAAADPSPRTVQSWLKWLDAAPENRQAFEELVEIWDKTPAAVIATSATAAGDDEYDGSLPIAQWRARTLRAPLAVLATAPTTTPDGLVEQPLAAALGRSASRRRRWALAACLVLSLALLAAYWSSRPRGINQGDFLTGIGEQRQLHLADDSTILLGPGSRLSVNLTASVRDVRLFGGEAYFSVAKDPSRLFTVHALNGAITAVGTAFDVRAVENRVTVIVTEGRIALTDTAANAATSARTLISPGEQVSYSPSPDTAHIETGRVQSVNTQDAVHWREGWLVYRNEPLRYVLADISRYTDLQFQLSPTAGDIPFSGAVHRDQIAEWLVALPEVAAVKVTHDGNHYNIDSRVQ
jgi:transmembrane sensor